jgi:flavin reductase (DIM6/NTAB) family NADH-FMN oxidoreductase RutF
MSLSVEKPKDMVVDTQTFRSVMGRFATGVTIVTTQHGPQRLGITVNAFCSVSLDPPLVLICIERGSRVHDALLETGVFAVNFLSEEQEQLSTCFAGNSEERYNNFCGVASHTVATGAPVFDDSLGFVDCRIVATYPGGDHTIMLGQVEALEAREGNPLLYYRSHYLHSTGNES